MKAKFQKRYVLAEGFPWALGVKNYTDVQMRDTNFGGRPVEMEWPTELWNADLPCYRLVLERVRGGK